MKRWLGVVLMALTTQGCVGLGDYKDLEGKHSHLLDVKETWESEQSDLSKRVEDIRLAYQRMTVDQGTLKGQLDSILQAVRSTKADIQAMGNKVEGQGNILKEQQHQMGTVTDHFSQVISEVATLSETNHMLANRVEHLTRVTKQTARNVADANKRMASAGTKRPPMSVESPETEAHGSKETPGDRIHTDVQSVSSALPPPGSVMSEVPAVGSPVTPVAPQPSLVVPITSASGEPTTATSPAVVGSFVKPLESGVSPTSFDVGAPTSDGTVSTSRWEQLKELFGKIRPVQKKGPEAPAPTAMSVPVPSTGSSHAGEAMASPFPKPQSLSTISSFPGNPAPGSVIVVPPVPTSMK